MKCKETIIWSKLWFNTQNKWVETQVNLPECLLIEPLPMQDFLLPNNQQHQRQTMNFNHYYPRQCFTTPSMLQPHKICTIHINTLSTINNLNEIESTSMKIDICHRAAKKYYAIDQITIQRDGYDIVDRMTSIIDSLIEVSIFPSFLCLLIIVFDEIDLNFDETSEFDYGCGNKTDATMILSMKLNIYHRKEYNFKLVIQITIGIDVIGITFIMNIVIIVLRLPSFLDALPIIFDGINSNLHKLIEFERNHSNNNNITIVFASVDTTRGTAIVFEFFVIVVYFIMQVIDESSLNILLLMEFGAIIVTITQLVLKLIVQTIICAVFSHSQVTRSVCGVFSSLFCPLSIFWGLVEKSIKKHST